MNFTRWSARLPGTQRRTAARTADNGGLTPRRTESPVPAARGERAAAAGSVGELPAREVLDRIPALVALVHGPEHRLSYLNHAYVDTFGPRTLGTPARETLTELEAFGLPALLDQVQRSGKPRTVKSRRAPGGRSYTLTCTPIDTGQGDPGTPGSGVLIFAADVTDHAEAAERLRTSERRQRETAVTLQRSLLPQELEEPDDLRIAVTYQPGGTEAAVGGDWYDVITLGGGRTALVIGDVMGRGVRAAAVMGQLRTAVRAYARLDLPPHEVLQLLDGLATEIDANQIATCAYAVHDPNEGRLVYSSAGHLPILVRDESGTVHRADEVTGPPLGTGGWLHASGSVPLAPGSTAVFYTDGLVERRGEDIDVGVSALERALASATGSPAAICDRLLRAAGVTADHDDDVAVLVLQHPSRAGARGELFRNAALDLLGGIEATPRARAFASGVLASWRFPTELRDLGVLAVSELVANSLQHGTPPMRLKLRRTDRRLIVEVTDADEHLPRRRRAEPGDETGRGISIIATIASNWGSRRTPGGGKSVWCEFALPQSDPPAEREKPPGRGAEKKQGHGQGSKQGSDGERGAERDTSA
ncbi:MULTISPECIES: SpoIIE family protein phosphatase [Streptomyces]|uniref:Magnesium or manganese-dependent protein phosphatase n=1 Tax=Streptomyces albus (strain ATCC 21838 / DSM 41398 / FERM P-419 / JCM 4703 / NBRC 107858) TaxID=1081613 RepID=A0A0B5EYH7_STRA4|nr:SpoIIE family protein phosphatase [Streptomyces sp. SCSIO ZS0520]AJE84390.1 magnesium or manganese-dependent protein phosphatase [Streptomyces albus]AOU78699.1 magnesium or manganese-dependent protein phosphatase [Streptomyces albus]AYN34437.1 PAS sensor protein [Streptomyces albus]